MTADERLMCADSRGRFTVAVTPSSRLSLRSTRATHEAQVIPDTASSTSPTRCGAATTVTVLLGVGVPDGQDEMIGSDRFAWRAGAWAADSAATAFSSTSTSVTS